MSNTIEEDPIGHTAKFLWIFSALPLIVQVVIFAMPPDMTADTPPWARYNGLIAAAVIAGLGYGVHKRSLLAARVGLAFFGLATVAMIAVALLKAEGRAGAVLAALPAWCAIKLHRVAGVLAQPRP